MEPNAARTPSGILAIEGPSAAGKTAVASALARRLGAVLLAEAYERLHPRPSLRFRNSRELLALERRLLREDARRWRAAVRARAEGRPVVADTGFLGPLTYTVGLVRRNESLPTVLDRLVAEADRLHRAGRLGLADTYAVLVVGPAERARRARADPRGHPADLFGRHLAVGRVEERLWREVIAPHLGPRVVFVSGVGSPEAVADRVLRRVRRRGPLPPVPTGTARRLLRAVGRPPAQRSRERVR